MNPTAYANRAISPFRRFNSQRIELFDIPAGRYKMQWQKFQFPTGWNSTLANQAGMSEEAFQFPTGWNSTSWNKQYPGFFKMFQFPTGWNSTKS